MQVVDTYCYWLIALSSHNNMYKSVNYNLGVFFKLHTLMQLIIVSVAINLKLCMQVVAYD